MHELSIALSILDIAEEESRRRGGAVIRSIHLALGPLAGVVKEALISAYELAREQSPFRESTLVIRDVPIRIHCALCNCESEVDSIVDLRCARCGQPASHVTGGREMEITAMEILE